MPLDTARPDIVFPPALQAVLDKALARMPSERYPNASQLGVDTESAVAGMELPGTRMNLEPVTSAATQLLDADAALKSIPTKKKAPAAAPAEPARKFPPVPVLGGVAGVGALAVVAVLALGGKKAPGTPSAADTTKTGQQTAATPNNPAPGPTGTQTANRTARTGAQPGPGPRSTAPGNTSVTPNTGTAVSPADSLKAAQDAFDAEQFDTAVRLGKWIYGWPAASGTQKAHAAIVVAAVYGQRNDKDNTIAWYRNALRYDPNNQDYKDAITNLGGTP
jgi:hypothetical protein